MFLDTTERAANIVGKYEHPAKGEAYRAEVHNLILEAELKEARAETKQTKEQAAVLVNQLQVEQDESVLSVLFTGGATTALGFFAGQYAQQYVKTNYPDNAVAKWAAPVVGTAAAVGTVLLESVTPEERAQGIKPDYMVMAAGSGFFGGVALGAGNQIYSDYKAANP